MYIKIPRHAKDNLQGKSYFDIKQRKLCSPNRTKKINMAALNTFTQFEQGNYKGGEKQGFV